ncbi:HlyD family type I secretion periplasmic adaptor subunit [Lentisphaera profundi]|uniref:HlyD family type I secretion periplasmic adaptor subunit n=1 Tax=Lentisphaera profundi TaxID=1658616 RepID=A0ABY7VXR9_9BACT|nr:HlyD family type I secretion periplasmic adaptor subunit [Lentisphaera profundi]WDE98512.1 HlyD family type I secretion periplasmic adaptor subunit [Lentisphaera profundi]
MKKNQYKEIIELAKNQPQTVFNESSLNHLDSNKKAISTVIILTTIFICSGIFWAASTSIDEVTKTHGQVIPVGDLQIIQSLEGGQITELFCKEGDIVEKGQLLLAFDPVHASTELNRLSTKQIGLQIKSELLKAFVQERKPDFTQLEKKYHHLIEEEREELLGRNKALFSSIAVEMEKSDAIQEQIRGIDRKLPALRRQAAADKEILKMYEDLEKADSVSKLEILNARKQEAEVSNRLISAQNNRKNLTEQLEGVEANVDKIKRSFFSEALQLRSQVLVDLAGLTEQIKESSSNLDKNTLKSPIAGIIKSLPRSSIGSVIPAGGVVAEIVPINTGYSIEIKISPKDIGFVKTGQNTQVKLDTYDFSRYGSIEGTITRISPTTFSDERGGLFYKGWVSPKQVYLGSIKEHKLLPGMTSEVDIITGNKTVFQYLLKPIYTTLESGLHER